MPRVAGVSLLSRLASDLIVNFFDTPWSPHDEKGQGPLSVLTFCWKPLLQYLVFPLQFLFLYSCASPQQLITPLLTPGIRVRRPAYTRSPPAHEARLPMLHTMLGTLVGVYVSHGSPFPILYTDTSPN